MGRESEDEVDWDVNTKVVKVPSKKEKIIGCKCFRSVLLIIIQSFFNRSFDAYMFTGTKN